ncbi:MAG: FIST C-terminal domain-containing protein [Epsilonproteobacteria bacterium]|nr:FIST C-terminal domain-containing protein [Campylobacterota bacterium]
MKVHNILFTTQIALEEFILKKKMQSFSNILVQIFSGTTEPEKFMSVAKTIKALLPQAEIIGAITSGEICRGVMYEGEIALSFSLFDATRVKSKLYAFDKRFCVEDIKHDLYEKETKALIVLSDGLRSNTELYIKKLHDINEDVTIAGGRAGDNAAFRKTYVFNEEIYTDNGWVLASLSSQELYVNTDYLLNWTPIGKEMIVTKCDGNILYELDGIPIVQVYRKYLGDDIVKNLSGSCMSFPLLTSKDGIEIARDPIAVVENDAMMYAGNFEKGDVVRFSFANIEDLTDNLTEPFLALSKYPSEAVYVYSCAARKALLAENLKAKLHLLESLAPSVRIFYLWRVFSVQ